MKRNGFSLIELIFVIIMLGIISSVAIVKMGEMAQRTQLTKLKAFVGTLNRSVSGSIWFKSIQADRHGDVAYEEYNAILGNHISLVPDYSFGPEFTNCNEDGTGVFLRYPYKITYEVHCKNGSSTTSPIFKLYDKENAIYVLD